MVKTEKTIEVSIDEFKVTEYELFGGQIDRINRNENPNIIPNSIYPPQKSPKFFPELAYLYAFSLTLEKYTRNVEPSTPRLTFIDQYSVDTYSETSFIEYDGSKNAAEFYYYYNTKDNKIFDRFISNSFRELNTKSTTSHKNPLTLGQVLTGDHIPTESENSTTVNVITTLNNAYQSEFSRIKGEKPEAAVGVTILTTAIFPTVKNITPKAIFISLS